MQRHLQKEQAAFILIGIYKNTAQLNSIQAHVK